MIGVVVITRNEEGNVRRTLESLSSELIAEIVVSDSNSSDDTEVVVNAVMASDSRVRFTCYLTGPFTAARGRNEGVSCLSGKVSFVLFLDGDMELKDGFLEYAQAELAKDPNLAGISGQMDNYYYNDALRLVKKQIGVYEIDKNQVGGALFIRLNCFKEVAGFNSNLIVNEEGHLRYKLSLKGYSVCRFDVPMIIHHTELPISKSRFRERFFDRKLTALGVNLYECMFDAPYLKVLISDNTYTLVNSILIVLLPLICLFDFPLALYTFITCQLFVAYKLRNLRVALNYFFYGVGAVFGFLKCLLQRGM